MVRRIFIVVVALVLMGWAALCLAPQSLGGKVVYSKTHGISMEPLYHQGDMVFVSTDGKAQVGDVILYESKALNLTVLHRVISMQDGYYTAQGDANDDPDSEKIQDSQILGRATVRAPAGTYWIPLLLVGLVGLALSRWWLCLPVACVFAIIGIFVSTAPVENRQSPQVIETENGAQIYHKTATAKVGPELAFEAREPSWRRAMQKDQL